MNDKIGFIGCFFFVGNAFNCNLVTLAFEPYKLCAARADQGVQVARES
jgi:hypothetical protein